MGLFDKQHNAKPARLGIPSDLYTDPRDGNTYGTIRIGTEVWMAKNLAFKADWPGCRAYKNDQGNVSTIWGHLPDFPVR